MPDKWELVMRIRNLEADVAHLEEENDRLKREVERLEQELADAHYDLRGNDL